MGKANTIAFDKTGTLTTGKLQVSDIVSFSDMTQEELLRLAASAESRSEHPLAKAITEKASSENVDLYEVSGFRMSAGKGISAEINGVQYNLGNVQFIRETGAAVNEEAAAALDRLRSEGKASVIISDAKKIAGMIALSDHLETLAVLASLESLEVHLSVI